MNNKSTKKAIAELKAIADESNITFSQVLKVKQMEQQENLMNIICDLVGQLDSVLERIFPVVQSPFQTEKKRRHGSA